MEIRNIYVMYFSPAGGTEKVAVEIAGKVGKILKKEISEIDYTVPENRKRRYSFEENDLVFLAMPVYAGRIPNKILPDLETGVSGSGRTWIVPISVYGNRSFGEALRELILLTEQNGFLPLAAAAVVSSHAFSETLAEGRPDSYDLEEMENFSKKIAEKIQRMKEYVPLNIERENPIGAYYVPLQEDGTPAKFLKAKPLTDQEKCIGCGLCAKKCPMGSISSEDFANVSGICIKCQSCVRNCPAGAKFFADEQFLSHVRMLESTYSERKENLFIEE